LGSIGCALEASFRSEVVETGRDRIIFRSFTGDQTVSDISGEVEGQHSRYGKIGLLWINKILQKNGVSDNNLVPTKFQIEKGSEYTDEFLLTEIDRIHRLIPSKATRNVKTVEKTRPNLVSKYQSLKLFEVMNSLSDIGRDMVTQDFFYYAMAISNYQFKCPVYVRVVGK
jgi:hypothetical protein